MFGDPPCTPHVMLVAPVIVDPDGGREGSTITTKSYLQ